MAMAGSSRQRAAATRPRWPEAASRMRRWYSRATATSWAKPTPTRALTSAAKSSSSAAFLQPLPKLMAAPDAGDLRFGVNGPNYSVSKFLPANDATVPQITAGMDLVNALFQGERVSAAQAFEAAAANRALPSFAFNPEKTLSANVAISTVHNHAENVIGVLEGSDPVLKHEYVIISAHLDHIGLATTPKCKDDSPELAAGDSTDDGLTMAPDQKDCDGINNGADDDGSGSTGLLGIAHAFAQGAAKGMRPKRTVLFIWNAGEEKGLWGSQYFN